MNRKKVGNVAAGNEGASAAQLRRLWGHLKTNIQINIVNLIRGLQMHHLLQQYIINTTIPPSLEVSSESGFQVSERAELRIIFYANF